MQRSLVRTASMKGTCNPCGVRDDASYFIVLLHHAMSRFAVPSGDSDLQWYFVKTPLQMARFAVEAPIRLQWAFLYFENGPKNKSSTF
jgi:hypothetical protein